MISLIQLLFLPKAQSIFWLFRLIRFAAIFTCSIFFFSKDVYSQWRSSCSAINTVICDAIDNQSLNQIIDDGQGGAIISWIDERGNIQPNPIVNIYIQKINNNGEK